MTILAAGAPAPCAGAATASPGNLLVHRGRPGEDRSSEPRRRAIELRARSGHGLNGGPPILV